MSRCTLSAGSRIRRPPEISLSPDRPPDMTPQNVLDLTREGLQLVFWVSLPVVLVAALTALLVALGQAVTQIQDQSIGQSIRLIAVMLALVVMAGLLGRNVLLFGERAFDSLVRLA